MLWFGSILMFLSRSLAAAQLPPEGADQSNVAAAFVPALVQVGLAGPGEARNASDFDVFLASDDIHHCQLPTSVSTCCDCGQAGWACPGRPGPGPAPGR
jgi:hypothetical protein